MNKKAVVKVAGETVVWLILLLFVIAAFLTPIVKIKDNTLHELRVEARDYAFTLDTLSISSNKLDYKYHTSKNVTFSLNEGTCQIEAKHELKGAKLIFFCAKDQNLVLNQQELKDSIRITN